MGLLSSKLKCGNAFITHLYLCPYLAVAAGTDAVSLSLIRFKQRLQPDLDAWIDGATQLLGALSFSADTIILRALRHDETTARTDFLSALDLLGQRLAIRLNCRYLPALLTKSRTTLSNKHLSRTDRRSQLQGVYHLTTDVPTTGAPNPSTTEPPHFITPSTPFLLIDDILTTGATMKAIILTLRTAYPSCPITAFTLTRAANTV